MAFGRTNVPGSEAVRGVNTIRANRLEVIWVGP